MCKICFDVLTQKLTRLLVSESKLAAVARAGANVLVQSHFQLIYGSEAHRNLMFHIWTKVLETEFINTLRAIRNYPIHSRLMRDDAETCSDNIDFAPSAKAAKLKVSF